MGADIERRDGKRQGPSDPTNSQRYSHVETDRASNRARRDELMAAIPAAAPAPLRANSQGRVIPLSAARAVMASASRDHIPNGVVGPPPKLPKDRVPVVEFLRQVAPRCARSHQPKHRVEHVAMVAWWRAAPRDQERFGMARTQLAAQRSGRSEAMHCYIAVIPRP
jgi:hypothetical protein